MYHPLLIVDALPFPLLIDMDILRPHGTTLSYNDVQIRFCSRVCEVCREQQIDVLAELCCAYLTGRGVSKAVIELFTAMLIQVRARCCCRRYRCLLLCFCSIPTQKWCKLKVPLQNARTNLSTDSAYRAEHASAVARRSAGARCARCFNDFSLQCCAFRAGTKHCPIPLDFPAAPLKPAFQAAPTNPMPAAPRLQIPSFPIFVSDPRCRRSNRWPCCHNRRYARPQRCASRVKYSCAWPPKNCSCGTEYANDAPTAPNRLAH